MTEQLSYLIIGNGIAGVTAAEILRAEDSAADITVIADDPFPVYYRPALKDYLAGRVREDKLWARPNSFYEALRIRFLRDRVVGIQAGQHIVQLRSGQQIGYYRLLLANGARASSLNCPGLNLTGVTTLRTVADYQAVLSRLSVVRRVVVSGSGTLALETIETLRHRGYQVTHLLRKRTLWTEVLDPTASDLVLQQERRDGVDVHLEEEIAEITGERGQVTSVVTTQGSRIPCEMVLIAIGVEPIIDFIKSSGIGCGRGVRVDGAMHTNAPDIYAAGDVLETNDAMTGRTRVIGQWYPAIQQARAAAYSMLDLLDTNNPFRSATFYNATFLYGLDFGSVGLANIPKGGQGYQEIVADPQPRTYRKVLLKNGVPVGMISLGDRKGALAFKRAIDHGVNLTPVASKLFANDFKLNEWLDKEGVPASILGVKREGDAAIKEVAYAGASSIPGVTVLKQQPITEAALVPNVGAESGIPKLVETTLSQTKVMGIGRQEGIYLLIDHGTVSRRHAEISYANGQYILHDLESTNGTFVNNTRLQPGSVHSLKQNDQLRFGTVARFTFQVRTMGEQVKQTRAGGPTIGDTRLHEMKTGFYDPTGMINQVLPLAGQPILNADGSLSLPGATRAVPAVSVATLEKSPALIVVTRGNPDVFLLKQGKRTSLGRDKGNDIVLADVASSREHAEVFPGPDGFYISDLGSSNGVIVNSTKIDNPYLLKHGDLIVIGSITIYFINVGTQFIASAIAIAPVIASQKQRDATIVCPNCGVENVPVARFCAGCGTGLGAHVGA